MMYIQQPLKNVVPNSSNLSILKQPIIYWGETHFEGYDWTGDSRACRMIPNAQFWYKEKYLKPWKFKLVWIHRCFLHLALEKAKSKTILQVLDTNQLSRKKYLWGESSARSPERSGIKVLYAITKGKG